MLNMNNPGMGVSLRGRQPNSLMYFGDWIELFELYRLIYFIYSFESRSSRGLVTRVGFQPQQYHFGAPKSRLVFPLA